MNEKLEYKYNIEQNFSWMEGGRPVSLTSSAPMTPNEVLAEALSFVEYDIECGVIKPPKDENWFAFVTHMPGDAALREKPNG